MEIFSNTHVKCFSVQLRERFRESLWKRPRKTSYMKKVQKIIVFNLKEGLGSCGNI